MLLVPVFRRLPLSICMGSGMSGMGGGYNNYQTCWELRLDHCQGVVCTCVQGIAFENWWMTSGASASLAAEINSGHTLYFWTWKIGCSLNTSAHKFLSTNLALLVAYQQQIPVLTHLVGVAVPSCIAHLVQVP